MDNNFLFLCVLQVTLANESIVLYMCDGKILIENLFFRFGATSQTPLGIRESFCEIAARRKRVNFRCN